MPRTSIQQRISQLEERKKALKARLGKQERREDTRRKVLIGALVLHRLEHCPDAEFTRRLGEWLARELPGFLVREGDRALFSDLLNRVPSKRAGDGATIPDHGRADGSTAV